MDLPNLLAGIYRHRKGGLYLVLGYGHDSNADDLFIAGDGTDMSADYMRLHERDVVIYVPLQAGDAQPGGRFGVRTASDFHAHVHLPDGDTCVSHPICDRHDQRHVRRFEYVGPSL